MLMAFILAGKIEAHTIQMTTLYTLDRLFDRPMFIGLVVAILLLFAYGVSRKNKLDYA